MSISNNDENHEIRTYECWKCELCETINRLKLTTRKYGMKCYGCKTIEYTPNKTEIIRSTTYSKPGEFLSQFRDEILTECQSFPNNMNKEIKNMDFRNQLLLSGYLRESNVKMPSSIINYFIVYLYLFEELYIGNLHKKHSKMRNRHIWTMFISTSKYKLVKPKSIKQVIYHIHPSYKTTRISVDEAPFYLKRRAVGSFQVKAEITFKNEYYRNDIVCYHDLNYKYYATLTPIEDEKTTKAKAGYEYYFKHDGIHYRDSSQFIIQ